MRKPGEYRCKSCLKDFNVRTGMPFAGSHLPPDKWLVAANLIRNGTTAPSELANAIGVSRKAAQSMLKKLCAKAP